MSWEAGGPVLRVNTLQLDREELLRWDECRVAATEYLRAQPERFDFAPIIERYMAGVRTFYRWFWEQFNERSSEVVAELNAKAMEVSALVERTRLAIRLAFRRRRHTTLRLEWSSRTRKAATTPIPTWVARFPDLGDRCRGCRKFPPLARFGRFIAYFMPSPRVRRI